MGERSWVPRVLTLLLRGGTTARWWQHELHPLHDVVSVTRGLAPPGPLLPHVEIEFEAALGANTLRSITPGESQILLKGLERPLVRLLQSDERGGQSMPTTR
jgi:hypothetical protein